MKRKFTAAAVLLAAAALLCACASPGTGDTTTAGDTVPVTAEPAPAPISLQDPDAKYTMIRSEKASDWFKSEYSKLRKDIAARTGVEPGITDDFLMEGTSPGELEIVVGDCNRPESAEAKALLSKGGFVVCVIGRKIVINGSTEKQVFAGCAWFVENVIGDGGGNIDPSLCHIEEGDFLIRNLTINGIPVKDFTVTVPSAATYRLPVQTLTGFLSRYAGITIGMSGADPGHQIVIGPPASDPSRAYATFQTEIYWKDGNLYLGAGCPSAAEQVIDTFLRMYLDRAGDHDIIMNEGETVYSSAKPDWGTASSILSDQDRVIRSCKKLQELLEFDHSQGKYFSYKNSGYEKTIAAARSGNNRVTNCVILTNWVLKDAGFYSSGTFNQRYDGTCGYVFSSSDCEKGMRGHFDIISAFKTVSSLKQSGDLYPGDIIVFSSLEHMQTVVDMTNAMDGGRSNCVVREVGANFRTWLGPNNFNSATAGYIFRAKDAIPAQ